MGEPGGDNLVDEAKLGEAVRIFCGAAPQAWVVNYFRAVICSIDEWAASGGGKLKKVTVRDKLSELLKTAEALQAQLSDWGGVFAEGDGNRPIIETARLHAPALIEAVKTARAKFPEKLKTGQNFATINENDLTTKELFALGVWIAASATGQTAKKQMLEETCTAMAKAGRLADRALYKLTEWGGINDPPKQPALDGSWTRALNTAESVKPRRNEAGALVSCGFEYPIMKSQGDFASEFWIKLHYFRAADGQTS